jgi:formylglycine-generating enzyme required for sulfatase activity
MKTRFAILLIVSIIASVRLIGAWQPALPSKPVAKPQYPNAIITKIDGAEMRLVSAGAFVYGSVPADLQKLPASKNRAFFRTENQPAERKQSRTGDFYIDIYEVTRGQYAKFLQATGHRRPSNWNDKLLQHSRYPVIGIGWDDAVAYAKWAGKRLPTEWEWEKAARGSDGRQWPWGNQFGVGNCNSSEIGLGSIAAVGTYKGVSPYGLFDMAGNVWEMCDGQWSDGKRSGPVMRGGCFNNDLYSVRTTVRWSPRSEAQTQEGAPWLGFRCVMDAGQVKLGENAESMNR